MAGTRGEGQSSVGQALGVLSVFTSREPELGVTQVSRRTGLSKARAHRYIAALARAGLLEQNPLTRRYRLGLRLLDLSRLVLQRLDFVAVAEPYLQQLAQWTELTVVLQAWDGQQPVAVRIVGGRGPINIGVEVGSRLPLNATAAGKVFLAFGPPRDRLIEYAATFQPFTEHTRTSLDQLERELAEVRARYLVVTDEEYVPGVGAIGAPIFNHTSALAASLTLVGTTLAIQHQLREHQSALLQATGAISRALGYRGEYGAVDQLDMALSSRPSLADDRSRA